MKEKVIYWYAVLFIVGGVVFILGTSTMCFLLKLPIGWSIIIVLASYIIAGTLIHLFIWVKWGEDFFENQTKNIPEEPDPVEVLPKNKMPPEKQGFGEGDCLLL